MSGIKLSCYSVFENGVSNVSCFRPNRANSSSECHGTAFEINFNLLYDFCQVLKLRTYVNKV